MKYCTFVLPFRRDGDVGEGTLLGTSGGVGVDVGCAAVVPIGGSEVVAIADIEFADVNC